MKVLGICGGNGVILWPFKKWLIGNIEPRSVFKTPGEVQWNLNFKGIPVHRDYNLKRYMGKTIDAIVGAPTCGHSSILALSRAKKYGDGKKDETIDLFIKAIELYKPKFFLFENLTNLFRSFPEDEFTKCFPGYKLKKWSVSVSVFGNSQINRKRLVVIGIREDLKETCSSAFKLPKEHSFKLKTVKELEKLLVYPNEDLFHIREPLSQVVTMEKDFKKLTLREVREIWNSEEYEGRKSWDATTTGKGRMKTLPGVYRNRPDDYPRTVLKNHRQFNTRGYMMSPRELAVIQGIPNEFKLYYDPNKLTYCLNKARVTTTKTPPMELQAWFAKCIRRAWKRLQ